MLASALPFVLLAVGLSVFFAVDQRRQTLVEMAETSRTLQRAIDREIELAEAILRALRLTRSIGEAVAAGPDGAEAERAAFHATATALVAEGRRTVHNISLHDASTGEQIVNTLRALDAPLPTLEEVSVPEARAEDDPQALVRAVFNRVIADRRLFVTDLYYGPAADQFLVSVMLPVERNGEVIAILSANLLPSALGQVLREQTPSIGYVTSVVDRDGIIIARTSEPERFVGTKASRGLLTFIADSALRELTERATTADGVEVYGVYRRLASAPWTIAYGAPVTEVDAPIRRLVLIMGGAGSLALGFFVAVSFWQAVRLTREMRELARDAERIGRGEPLPERVDRVREVAGVRRALRAGVASLAGAEERMRLAIEGSGMATWDIDRRKDEVAWAGHFLDMLGLPPDLRGPVPLKAWLDRVHPDDLQALDAQWKTSSREGTRFHSVYRIARADDDALRWLESYGAHLRCDGQHRLIGVTFDVTDRHRAEEQRQLLMREVDHRAKNALAVVQSVVRLTRATDPASYATAVEGRVGALARAHDLLARDRWAGASLAAVASEELAAQTANGQVTTAGPSLLLVAEAVQPISMVLHELATNAAKYGAFSVPDGHVRLAWRLGAGDEQLRLEWIERGGPPASAPPAVGFGTRLIELTVESQLGGTVEFDWAPAGLSCVMTLPHSVVGGKAGAPAAVSEKSTEPEAKTAGLEGRRVIVVEDEAMIGAELVQSLSRAGCRPLGPFATVEAADAALAEWGSVDAAVLDVNLGRSDSLQLARDLLAAGVPVVLVTGYSVLPAAWAGEKGLGAVLHKPVDPAELISALGQALQRQRAA